MVKRRSPRGLRWARSSKGFSSSSHSHSHSHFSGVRKRLKLRLRLRLSLRLRVSGAGGPKRILPPAVQNLCVLYSYVVQNGCDLSVSVVQPLTFRQNPWDNRLAKGDGQPSLQKPSMAASRDNDPHAP